MQNNLRIINKYKRNIQRIIDLFRIFKSKRKILNQNIRLIELQ